MPVKSKSQLAADIAGSTFTAPQKVILDDIVLSYEDILPLITTVQRDALTPTVGQLIYNTDTDQYEYWNGTLWAGMGQSLGVPQTVKVEVSSAELLNLASVAKDLIAAPGAGLGIAVTYLLARNNYNSIVYDFADVLQVITQGNAWGTFTSQCNIGDSFMNAATTGMVSRPCTGGDATVLIVKANEKIQLKADANPTQGNGTLTLWLTYITVTL